MSSPFPEPSPEHRILAEQVGTWNVACEYFQGPGQTYETQAVEEVSTLGGFWIEGRFKAEMMGMPFEGRATLGFNPTSGKYVSTWIDTLTPYLFVFEGERSDNVIEFSGNGPNPGSGEIVPYRTREEHRADGTRVFEMWCGSGSDEFQVFRYTYSRAAH